MRNLNFKSKNINLVFDGLDTYATIFLNDKIIGKSKNMFVRYVFDVTSLIKVIVIHNVRDCVLTFLILGGE